MTASRILLTMSSFPHIPHLSPEAQLVEERAMLWVRQESEALMREYRQRFGPLVSTDLARELFDEYAASIEARLRFASAVQRSAAKTADNVFAQILSEPGLGMALFTAGGTGAGKTTSIRSTDQTASLLSNARVIYDSNFNSLGSAKAKVELAIASGSIAIVIFVHRHPVESYLQGVLPRALDEVRTVSIIAHLRMHRDSLKTFLRVQRAFSGNPKAAFMVLNNTGHATEAFPADIGYLKGVKYDQDEIFKAIKEGLEHAYRQGKISQDLYEASCGDT